MNLIPIVSDLLLRSQRATIPEFGTFMITKDPARLNKTTRVLLPPSLTVKFDKNQKTDDGQLSGYLTKKLKINYAAALKGINEFAQGAMKQLKEKGITTFEGLGTLKAEKTGEYSFIPDEELLKRIKIFELPKLNIISETPSQQVSKPITPPVIVRTKQRKRSRWWIPVGILIIVAITSVAVYYTGIFPEIQSATKSIFTAERKHSVKEKMVFGKRNGSDSLTTSEDTLKEIISKELEERTNREKALAYKENSSKIAQEDILIREKESLNVVSTEKQYHIIAGAFLVPNNAERQRSVLENKGYTAVILPKKGDYYMVSLGSYDSNDIAMEAMLQFENNLKKKLWILKNK